MNNILKPVGFVHRLFLAIFLGFLLASLFYAFSYWNSLYSNLQTKTSDTAYSEDVIVVFSSSKSSYMAGENAVFCIEIMNRRESPFSKINFSVEVKALSMFGIKIFSKEGQSTRLFMPGKFERLEIFSKGAIEVILPGFIPPGFFMLELSAQSASIRTPQKASIMIYVAPSMPLVNSLVISLMASSTLYVLIAMGAKVEVKSLKTSSFGRIALLAYWAYSTSKKVDIYLKRTLDSFSDGQKIIFIGICITIVVSFAVALRLEDFANDLAIVVYFSFLIGVINLLWEVSGTKAFDSKYGPSARLAMSMFILGFLTYLSSRFLGGMIIILTMCIMIYMRARKLLNQNIQT